MATYPVKQARRRKPNIEGPKRAADAKTATTPSAQPSLTSGTDDSAARREAGVHSVAGGGGAQHAFDCRGSRCPAAHCQPLAAARFAEHGLGGLKDRPRAGKKPIYDKATNKRILVLLEKPPPAGYARWTGPLLPAAAPIA